ncbi:MAG: hypothetical protein Q9219_001814 [cf. Caloplaca sp. 3 TL-2023]
MIKNGLSYSRTRQLYIGFSAYSTQAERPIVSIVDASFYREHPTATARDASSNPVIFPNLSFEVPSSAPNPQHWAVIGSSPAGKTTFFEILRGQHLCFPPTARSFPYLSDPNNHLRDHRLRIPSCAIQYVGFAGKHGRGLRGGSTTGAYLSARYESRREETDFTVRDFLTGNIQLNPTLTGNGDSERYDGLQQVAADLNLESLMDMPVGNLSNGQTRRAKIAKALLERPEVLLLDEPFIGLDPPTKEMLSPLLYNLAQAQAPRILISLKPQDRLPEWITHVVLLGPDLRVAYQGIREKATREKAVAIMGRTLVKTPSSGRHMVHRSKEGLTVHDEISDTAGEPIIEMRDIVVRYGDKVVLGNWEETINNETRRGFQWTVRRGERWGLFGPNGSGKTTLLSLICSDHPQSYSLPITLFSHPRLPRPGVPGISIFDLQSRIGQSSPEIHNFFPKNLSLRRVIESAWADTFLSPPTLTYKLDELVDTYLRWFEPELNPFFRRSLETKSGSQYKSLGFYALAHQGHSLRHGSSVLNFQSFTGWADTVTFSSLPFSAQRLALFLRAIIKKPDLVVLDEAFSGMDASLRNKCLLFLTWGTTRYFRPEKNIGSKLYFSETPAEIVELMETVEGLEERQALIVVSHVREEVPGLVRDWVCLPVAEEGGKPRFGRLRKPLELVPAEWERIWGVEVGKPTTKSKKKPKPKSSSVEGE